MDHVAQIDHSYHETRAAFAVERYSATIGWPKGQRGQPLTKADIEKYEENMDLTQIDSGVLVRLQIAYNCTFIFTGHTVMMEVDGGGHPVGPKDFISTPEAKKKASFREGTGSREAAWILIVDTYQGHKSYGSIEQFEPQAPFAPLDRLGR